MVTWSVTLAVAVAGLDVVGLAVAIVIMVGVVEVKVEVVVMATVIMVGVVEVKLEAVELFSLPVVALVVLLEVPGMVSVLLFDVSLVCLRLCWCQRRRRRRRAGF